MITFLCALALLIGGYFLYGRLTERVFRPDDRPTPAVAHPDGVDYVPMKTWRVFLIQLLNIAGTGPIFGALMGAVFGPVVFLWIVFGSILGGVVHDYMSGMISVRMNGASISEIVGKYLGRAAKQVMRVFSVVLLILVGAVFTTSPAALLARLTPEWMNTTFWVVVILVYYLLATLLPIDQIIGRLYPVFGVVLVLMAVGIVGGLLAGGYALPELSFANRHPQGQPVWPYMFVTVACGAVSGFHATQSPMMARCLRREKDGRRVFYGAMLAESVIALIWAAAGVAFYGATGGLQQALADLGQSGVVYDISVRLLGMFGGALAIVGVVVCPVSSGDTAFRSARLTIADWFGIDQSRLPLRLAVFFLEQPDTGHDYPLGRRHVPGPPCGKALAFGDLHRAGRFYVGGLVYLYSDGGGGPAAPAKPCLPHWRGVCAGLRGAVCGCGGPQGPPAVKLAIRPAAGRRPYGRFPPPMRPVFAGSVFAPVKPGGLFPKPSFFVRGPFRMSQVVSYATKPAGWTTFSHIMW